MSTINEMTATGRRKSATARVRLMAGKGDIVVNGKKFEEYFEAEALRAYVMQVFQATNTAGQYDIIARIAGGGKAGQAGALRHGIARALVLENEDLRKALRDNNMLTRDPREKERKKPGQPGARRRFQFSKR